MTKLTQIEGIGPSYAAKLESCGLKSQESFLKECCGPSGRKVIAKQSGISESKLLNWLNRADLARVKGIGEEYSDLLEASGVDTVPELAQRNFENLYITMKQVNEKQQLVRALPSLNNVKDWIQQAKKLPRMIRY